MNNCAVLHNGPGFWSAAVVSAPALDDAVSVASSVSVATTAVKHAFRRYRLARNLNILSNKLSGFLDGVYKAVEEAEKGKRPKQKTGDVAVTKESLESTIKALEYLYDVTTRIYLTCEAHRLTNDSRMSASLRTIHKRAEELLDIADWLHTAIHSSSSKLDALYEQARADLAEGKVYDFSQVG